MSYNPDSPHIGAMKELLHNAKVGAGGLVRPSQLAQSPLTHRRQALHVRDNSEEFKAFSDCISKQLSPLSTLPETLRIMQENQVSILQALGGAQRLPSSAPPPPPPPRDVHPHRRHQEERLIDISREWQPPQDRELWLHHFGEASPPEKGYKPPELFDPPQYSTPGPYLQPGFRNQPLAPPPSAIKPSNPFWPNQAVHFEPEPGREPQCDFHWTPQPRKQKTMTLSYKLDKFTGDPCSTSWKDWIDNFHRYCRAQGFSDYDPEAADRLGLNCAGEALSFFNTLPLYVRRNYQRVLEAMEEEYGAVHGVDLQNMRKRPGEQARTFSTRFKSALRAFHGEQILNNPFTFKWIFDLYRQAIGDPQAIMYVSAMNPTTLQEACRALVNYEDASTRFGPQPTFTPRLNPRAPVYQCDTTPPVLDPPLGPSLQELPLTPALMRAEAQKQRGKIRTFQGVPAPYRGFSEIC